MLSDVSSVPHRLPAKSTLSAAKENFLQDESVQTLELSNFSWNLDKVVIIHSNYNFVKINYFSLILIWMNLIQIKLCICFCFLHEKKNYNLADWSYQINLYRYLFNITDPKMFIFEWQGEMTTKVRNSPMTFDNTLTFFSYWYSDLQFRTLKWLSIYRSIKIFIQKCK